MKKQKKKVNFYINWCWISIRQPHLVAHMPNTCIIDNGYLIKMKVTNEKPNKKIIINNVRKSLVIGNTIPTPKSPMVGKASGTFYAPSEQENQFSSNYHIRDQNIHERMEKMNEQLRYYRDKHDQSLIKVRFLTDQLSTFAGLDKVPPTIKTEISETDAKIKTLEELLNFKRSKQMKKLRKRVRKFVEMMEFELSEEDMDKMEDQIEIIFFVMDVFTEKYNELMKERQQIDQIVQNLKNDTVFNREQLQEQITFYHDKNMQMTDYIRDLELELFNYKREHYSRNTYQGAIKNQNIRIYDETIRNLQTENQNLVNRVKELDGKLRESQFSVINFKRRLEECEGRLLREQSKNRQLQFEFERVQKEEVRWKQRYLIMEEQKNQRIRLLEEEKHSLQNGIMRRSRGQYQNIDVGQAQSRKRVVFDRRFQCNDEIVEDSGEEYYDLNEN